MSVKGANAGWKFLETLQRWCSFEKLFFWFLFHSDWCLFLFFCTTTLRIEIFKKWLQIFFVSLLLLYSLLLSCTISVSLLSGGLFADVTAVCFLVTFEEQRLKWPLSCSEVTASSPSFSLASWHRAASKPFLNSLMQGSCSEVSSNNTFLSMVSPCLCLSIPICYR